MTDRPMPRVTPEEELVAADDTIIGRAFVWSLVVFVAIGAVVGASVWLLSRPKESILVHPAPPVPAKSLSAGDTPPPQLPFVNVTDSADIDFVRENGAEGEKLLPETMGGGAAFFDFDSDGDQDLLLINSTHWPHSSLASSHPTHALYRNDGQGAFTNVTSGSGLDTSFYGMGVATGDYDNDGDVDLYITAVGPNHLYRNDGSGHFTDVTATAAVAGGENDWSTSAGFFDYDNDGDLDLFVCNYVKWSRNIDLAVNYTLSGIGRAYGPPTNFEGANNVLYRNNGAPGGGTFSDVSKDAGIHVFNRATGVPAGKALGVAFIDVDRDGNIDVVVANDTVAKFFYHNNGAPGSGTFTEMASDCGLAFDRNGMATGAMGIDAAHYRNNSDLGVGIGNFANEMTSLYVSQGSPLQFADEAITEGIGAPTRLMLSFGLLFLDADLDGRLDLLQANGHLEEDINVVQSSQHYQQPAQLFWNAGPQARACFVDVPASMVGNLSQPIVGRGAAYADIDADGDVDVILTQPKGKPLLLRNNQSLGHHWLRIKLVGDGRKVNRDAIGAWIELTSNGETQRRQVMPTRSYLSQVELPVTFGLGEVSVVDSLTVRWPDGTEQQVTVLGVDRTLVIEFAK
jgi:hypothetical protein